MEAVAVVLQPQRLQGHCQNFAYSFSCLLVLLRGQTSQCQRGTAKLKLPIPQCQAAHLQLAHSPRPGQGGPKAPADLQHVQCVYAMQLFGQPMKGLLPQIPRYLATRSFLACSCSV